MGKVETLRGAIDTSDLGFTLMHEHVFLGPEGLVGNFPCVWNKEEKMAEAREKLQKAYRLGVRTIVDHTVMGLNRDIPTLLGIASDLPINIVVSTGLYYFQELPMYFESQGVDVLVDAFVGDIQRGIQGTSVKAGIVKAVTEAQGLTPGVEKQLRAAARAHRKTGAVLSTHSHSGTRRGLDQQRIFEEEGVDLKRVLIGHCGDSEDLDYLKQVLSKGSFIGMDRFGYEPVKGLEHYGFLATSKRVEVISELCRQGYAAQMILSQDAYCFSGFSPEHIHSAMFPNSSHHFLLEQVISQLLNAGVTTSQIDQMTMDNPRNIFEANGTPY